MKPAQDNEQLDVVLVAFEDGNHEAPAAGLQRVFGIDRATADTLLDRMPTTVQRRVSPVRAAYFVRALALIGGRAEARNQQGVPVRPTGAPANVALGQHPVAPPAPALPAPAETTVVDASPAGAGAAARDAAAQTAAITPAGAQTDPRAAAAATFAHGPPSNASPLQPTSPLSVDATVAEVRPRTAPPRPAPPASPRGTLVWGAARRGSDAPQAVCGPARGAHTSGRRPEATHLSGGTGMAAEAARGPTPLAPAVGLPRHASTVGKEVLDVLDPLNDGQTRAVTIGKDPADGPGDLHLTSAMTTGRAVNVAPPGTSNTDRAAWRGLPPPVLSIAEIERRFPRPLARRQQREGQPGAPPHTGLTLATDDAEESLQVMGLWEQPGSRTVQRYQHPMVPQGRPLASPLEGATGPSAGPSYRPPDGPGQRVSPNASFWEAITHGASVPFLGAGTLWIVGLCLWSMVGGALSAAAGNLPETFVLAGVLLVVLTGSSLLAFGADFFRACFWAVLEGKDQTETAPTLEPGRMLDQYVGGGLNLLFFQAAGLLPVAIWSFVRLRGDDTAETLLASPGTWLVACLPLTYWPMALTTAAVGHRLGAVWSLGTGLVAIVRAPLAYVTVVALGTLSLLFAGAVFAIVASVTGQTWLFLMGSGFPVAISMGVTGALMGHLVRANPEVLE